MSIESQMDREEEELERQLNDGEITNSEYTTAMNNLQREYREMARESAEQAYDQELERW